MTSHWTWHEWPWQPAVGTGTTMTLRWLPKETGMDPVTLGIIPGRVADGHWKRFVASAFLSLCLLSIRLQSPAERKRPNHCVKTSSKWNSLRGFDSGMRNAKFKTLMELVGKGMSYVFYHGLRVWKFLLENTDLFVVTSTWYTRNCPVHHEFMRLCLIGSN